MTLLTTCDQSQDLIIEVAKDRMGWVSGCNEVCPNVINYTKGLSLTKKVSTAADTYWHNYVIISPRESLPICGANVAKWYPVYLAGPYWGRSACLQWFGENHIMAFRLFVDNNPSPISFDSLRLMFSDLCRLHHLVPIVHRFTMMGTFTRIQHSDIDIT